MLHSVGLGKTSECAFLTSSQVTPMLLVWDHTSSIIVPWRRHSAIKRCWKQSGQSAYGKQGDVRVHPQGLDTWSGLFTLFTRTPRWIYYSLTRTSSLHKQSHTIHFLDHPPHLPQIQQNETTCLYEKGFLYFIIQFMGPVIQVLTLLIVLSSIT